MDRRQFLAVSAAAAVVPSWSSAADWPTARPIRLLVGFPPGGGADAMARLVAAKLATQLGASMVVENRTGATGTICSDLVAKSAPDGFTLQMAHPNSNVVGPLMVAKDKFDPINDFTPIAMVAITPQILVVNPKVTAKTVAEVIAYAKANPGKLTFMSSGVGSVQHLAGEAFKHDAKVDMLHVPYKGTGEAMTSLLAGEVDMSFSSMGAALPQVKAGKLRLIATCTESRLKSMPEVPAIAETLPGFSFVSWYGLAGPAKLPPEIVQRLHKETASILALNDVTKRMSELDAEVSGGTSESFAKFWKTEVDKYRKLIQTARISTS